MVSVDRRVNVIPLPARNAFEVIRLAAPTGIFLREGCTCRTGKGTRTQRTRDSSALETPLLAHDQLVRNACLLWLHQGPALPWLRLRVVRLHRHHLWPPAVHRRLWVHHVWGGVPVNARRGLQPELP